MASRLLIAGSLLLLGAVVTAQTPPPGSSVWGTNRFIEYIPGNAPLVIAMAHGGYLKPPTLRDRTFGVVTQDARTQETGQEIARKFRQRFGLHPHLVINQLHRIKLDANREIVEAAQGDPQAERAWREFHSFIDTARQQVRRDYGRGLFLDLHGHGHPIDWVEIGYRLTAAELNLSNAQLDGTTTYRQRSSIRALATTNSTTRFSELLRGPSSLGGRLEAGGLLVVPGPRNPGPGNQSYFRGGYNTQRWGSALGGSVDAIQIELPSSMRRDLAGRNRFTTRLVDSFEPYFASYYGIDLRPRNGGRLSIDTPHAVATERGERGAVRVTRTGPTSAPLFVSITVSGTATAGRDYRALPATIMFPAGVDSVTLPIEPLQDQLMEGQETIYVQLLPALAPGGPRVGHPAAATVILLDDEAERHRIGHWKLDEGQGDLALDSSVNGRTGTLRPPASGPSWSTGQLSAGLSFDEVDDHVVVPRFDYAHRGEFTLSLWFNIPPSQQSSTQYLFSHGDVNDTNSLNIYWFEDSNLLRVRVRCQTELTPSHLLDLPTTFIDGTWHHLALVVERGFGYASVFVDGALQARNLLNGDDLAPTGDIHLGGRHDTSSSRFLRGNLDDVQIWDRGLSAREVRELMAADLGYRRMFGDGCPTSSSRLPTHSANGRPAAGETLTYSLGNAQPATAGLLYFGFSRSTFLGNILPMELGPFGAPGCALLQDAALMFPVGLNSGAGSLQFTLPNNLQFRGLRIFSQGLAIDRANNAAGFAVSPALETVVGG